MDSSGIDGVDRSIASIASIAAGIKRQYSQMTSLGVEQPSSVVSTGQCPGPRKIDPPPLHGGKMVETEIGWWDEEDKGVFPVIRYHQCLESVMRLTAI